MKTLPPSDTTLSLALSLLTQGRIVVHATETCYGLACDLTNPKAVAKLFSIKKRPLNQPVSVLFCSIEQVKEYVAWSDAAEKLATLHLPGPLTLILPRREHTPRSLFTTPMQISSTLEATLGLRLSSHPIAQELVLWFGRPLSTTSANIHGKPNLYSVQDVFELFSREQLQPDLIIDSGLLPANPPSTVIDLTTGEKTLLRRGNLCL